MNSYTHASEIILFLGSRGKFLSVVQEIFESQDKSVFKNTCEMSKNVTCQCSLNFSQFAHILFTSVIEM